ncbi:MAG TPA: ATP-binding protein [Acidimicrobiales bacterium]|jgi:K+-sensing histidine kinase KdpD|nr:ATP-binding protein [Acidimicrobiales bacterium]
MRVRAFASGPAPWAGLGLGAGLTVVVTAALVPLRSDVTQATPALVLVVPVVVAAVIGGRPAALVVAVLAAGAFNVAFIPPYWNPRVGVVDDEVALAVFLAVAVTTGTLVAQSAERRQAAEQRAEEIQGLHDRYEVVVLERERLAEEANRVAVLEQVDEQRSALLRSVSHDLRTPLASIRAVTSDLRAGAIYDDATRNELLDLVGDEAQRLDRIVANLLSLSRIEAGALQPDRQAVAVDELLAERVRRLAPLFRQVRVQVDVPDGLPLVDADYTQLDQVVTNLLENAARHSPPRSTIRVSAITSDGLVEISVADEGIGVARFDRERIFEPFRRGEGSASSGVGLAICKAIVEAHGGTIDVAPNPGSGARFRFTIPTRRG